MTFTQTKEFILKKMAIYQFRRQCLTYRNGWKTTITMVSSPVVARTRKLKARWRAEEDQELQVTVDPSVEEQLARILDSLAHDP